MPIQKLYQNLSPSGTLSTKLRLYRERTDERVKYEGTVWVEDARATYHKFPYPLEKIHGTVQFSDELVQLTDLRGTGPTGARVALQGAIAPPGAHPAIHLTITGQDVPGDRWLYEALPPKHRPILDLFANQQAYDRLTSRAVVQSSDNWREGLQEVNRLESLRRQLAMADPPRTRQP